MPHSKLTQFLLLPKLRLVEFGNITRNKVVIFHCETNSTSDFCPHCGLETSRIHDHRVVTIIDAPHASKKKTHYCMVQNSHSSFESLIGSCLSSL